jgi:GNAT superfamily N-acetyltransferase
VTEQVVRGKLVTYPNEQKLLAEAEIGGTPFSAIKRVTRKNAECTYYFGEFVLHPEFRGTGIGHGFLDERQGSAQETGASATAFAQ